MIRRVPAALDVNCGHSSVHGTHFGFFTWIFTRTCIASGDLTNREDERGWMWSRWTDEDGGGTCSMWREEILLSIPDTGHVYSIHGNVRSVDTVRHEWLCYKSVGRQLVSSYSTWGIWCFNFSYRHELLKEIECFNARRWWMVNGLLTWETRSLKDVHSPKSLPCPILLALIGKVPWVEVEVERKIKPPDKSTGVIKWDFDVLGNVKLIQISHFLFNLPLRMLLELPG